MKTLEALLRFYSACKEKGLSPKTISGYQFYLGHFAAEYPELPTDTESIEAFLKVRKEGPGHRGQVFKRVQAFYSWLEKADGIKSPVPPRGKMGRPPKLAYVPDSEGSDVEIRPRTASGKVVEGGYNVSKYTSISTYQAVLAFIRNRRTAGLKPKTIEWYEELLAAFMRKFPKLPVQGKDIDPFFDNPRWGNESRQGARRAVVALYNFLVEQGTIPEGMVKVTRIKREKKLRRILTHDDLKRLWVVAANPQEKAILATLLDTKCRAGEMLSMTREGIFPDHALVDGKVGQRIVYISKFTYDLLCSLVKAGPLFLSFGHPMGRGTIYDIVHGMMLRAGLSGAKLGPHILRHTAAVEHIMAGGDMMSLQQELGHASPEMTAHYAHLATGQLSLQHQRVDLLNKLIDEEPPAGAGKEEEKTAATATSTGGSDSQPPSEPTPPAAEPRYVGGIRVRKI